MPELTECMYAHQQICIPPTFPYLLRQYAKAAIRSQPIDLLKWSCAYFKALSMSLPPPVKLRLEYPISKTHYGLTPGWLKTLLRQFSGYTNVTWPLLVDRWAGACMDLAGLVEIILSGNFPDPANMDWLKFVATAAGFLTPNLTSTMILICELLTEEPEGGSAMINVGVFVELYTYLAKLDCGEEKIVQNYYYTESNLSLKKKMVEEGSISCICDHSTTVSTIVEGADTEVPGEGGEMPRYPGSYRGESAEDLYLYQNDPYLDLYDTVPSPLQSTSITITGEQTLKVDSNIMIPPTLEKKDSCLVLLEQELDKEKAKELSEKTTSSSETTQSLVEKISAPSYDQAESVEEITEPVSILKAASHTGQTSTESSATEISEVVRVKIPMVPGIGPVLPQELIDAVVAYMRNVGNLQQGMVMPRNIRHYLCPPLEEMEL